MAARRSKGMRLARAPPEMPEWLAVLPQGHPGDGPRSGRSSEPASSPGTMMSALSQSRRPRELERPRAWRVL
jgi:hypothetical protein